jgi:hypothetical protein
MTSGFQSDTIKVSTSDGRSFTLLEPVVYVTALGAHLTIPAGTTSDGASTPSALWTLIPPFGPYFKATYLHDWLYRFTKMPKCECDDLLKEAMLTLGIDPVLADAFYEGVSKGGQSSFDVDRAKQKTLL